MSPGAPTERARVIDCRQGAVRAVFDAASSSDNSQLAAGGADKALTVFDVETGKQLRRWRAHGGDYKPRVNCVAFNEESNVVFSASMDCTLQAFDNRSRSEKPIQIFTEATDSVLSVDINGHEIVTGSADSNYRVYNIRDGNVNIDFLGETVNCVHFTPDSNCVLASTQDGHVRLMDKISGKMLARFIFRYSFLEISYCTNFKFIKSSRLERIGKARTSVESHSFSFCSSKEATFTYCCWSANLSMGR
uniref:WD repeat domain-containing protein 83 n=1 Tax=Heterorhabditis bacteriophora TaxID=37862 RepID=A0A1I7XTG9_HETBA